MHSFYLIDGFASGAGSYGKIQDGGSAPSTQTFLSTSWTTAGNSSGSIQYGLLAYNTTGDTVTSTTALPNAAPDGTHGFRTDSSITDTIAAGHWLLNLAFRINNISSGTPLATNARVRVWKSANQDGSSATELTTAPILLTTIGTSVGNYNTTGTWNAPVVALSGEYLFFIIALEDPAGDDGVFTVVPRQDGTNSVITTPQSVGAAAITLGSSAVLKGVGQLQGTASFSLGSNTSLRGYRFGVGSAPISFGSVATIRSLRLRSGVATMSFDGVATLHGTGRLAGTSPIAFFAGELAIANGSFEVAGATPGAAASWSFSSNSNEQLAPFDSPSAFSWDDFEEGWVSGFLYAFGDPDLALGLADTFTVADFVRGIAGVPAAFGSAALPFESFEVQWHSNESYLTVFSGSVGVFTGPQNYDDFESGWDSNESYVTTFSGTAALYDAGANAYENFEGTWP